MGNSSLETTITYRKRRAGLLETACNSNDIKKRHKNDINSCQKSACKVHTARYNKNITAKKLKSVSNLIPVKTGMTISIFALHTAHFCRETETRHICQCMPDSIGSVHKVQKHLLLCLHSNKCRESYLSRRQLSWEAGCLVFRIIAVTVK